MTQYHLKKIQEGIGYAKEKFLGSGAFAEVYLGFDDNRSLPMAVKVVSLKKIENNQDFIIKKIKDEIVNMQIAKHENIVQFYQAKNSKRNIYIFCQYCNGGSLDSFIKNRGYLTEYEALGYFSEILKGFQQMYFKKIVHRDLKPANLLLHNYSIKIGDLGYSKSIQGHEQLLESTVGTPLYMSPQIFSKQKYTQKTDVWSLGVILYEMLYGRVPWNCHGKSLLELKDKIYNEEIKFPNYPYITKSTKSLIKGMLKVEEKDRVSWQHLFKSCLKQKQQIVLQYMQQENLQKPHLHSDFYNYFQKSFCIQSHQHLHKILKVNLLATQQQLEKCYHNFKNSQQFYRDVKYRDQNEQKIKKYYGKHLEKRNQISYLLILCQKLEYETNENHTEIILVNCLIMLILKFSLTEVANLLTYISKQISLPQNQQIESRLCYTYFLRFLLTNDFKRIKEALDLYTKYFQNFISELESNYEEIFGNIRKDLSGIYGSENSDTRIVRFFMNNYLKKYANFIKTQQIKQSQQKPHKFVVNIHMINQYLTNKQLFTLHSKPLKGKNKKNLNQFIFESQTILTVNEINKIGIFEEDSIDSLISKSFQWNYPFKINNL